MLRSTSLGIFLGLTMVFLVSNVESRAMKFNNQVKLNSMGGRYFRGNQNKDGSMVAREKRNISLQPTPTASTSKISSPFCFVRIKYICKDVCMYHVCTKLCVPYQVLDCIAIKGQGNKY